MRNVICKFFGVVMMAMTLTMAVNAQTPQLPYFCGFETAAENADWTYLTGSSCNNNWSFGTAVHNFGTHAMYISANNGNSATYVNTKGSAIAYRQVNFPAGQFIQIDFDWMARGNATDKLYVCYVTNPNENLANWATNNNAVPSGVTMYAKPWQQTTAANGRVTRDTVMQGRSDWRHGSFEVVGTGQNGYIVFFWTNSQGAPLNPGGCIDNVQFNRKSACPKPTNLQYQTITGSSGVLTWTSTGTSWDVMYNNNNSNQWNSDMGLTQPSDTITGLVKGMYTFWVRAHCGNDSSSWAVVSNILVYQSLAECLDYINLTAPYVQATIGSFSSPYNANTLVDNGSSAMSSRHTIHYGQGEYDPRTNNLLQTVPRGEVASVRLGNWDTGGQAESLTYTYTVDSAAAIMILKYAVVLEDPTHPSSAQPRFKMEVLNQYNQLIDPTCGAADFIPGTNTQSWNVAGEVKWKDWTILGMNLQPYAGQTIKIRFTTYDCDYSGHYGYAYFTLDCAYATISGESCGTIAVDSIAAPDGFAYTWYNTNDMNTPIATTQAFQPAPGDTSNYVCRVSFIENPSCYFDLHATTKPRWPWAEALYNWNPRACENRVDFTNLSHIFSSADGHTQDPVTDLQWDFGNGTTSTEVNPSVVFPDQGGTYHVRLIANMVGGLCSDTTYYDVVVPSIAPDSTVTRRSICQGNSITWLGETYSESIDTTVVFHTSQGCDSLVTLHLNVLDVLHTDIDTTICEGQSVTIVNNKYTRTGYYTDTTSSSLGCDSIITLNLVVNPILGINLQQIGEICADDGAFLLKYTNTGSTPPTDFSIAFDQSAKTAGFVDTTAVMTDGQLEIEVQMPASVLAGTYTATLTIRDSVYGCNTAVIPFTFQVQYRKSIVEQKWNDVLAVLNSQYNGDLQADGTPAAFNKPTVNGYNFVAFQWYMNELPMEGETGSYLYRPEGLDMTAVYRVLLTRDDGVSVMSCGITPVQKSDVKVVPTFTMPNHVICISTSEPKGSATLWTTDGMLVGEYLINSEDTYIHAPSQSGIYILNVRLNNGKGEAVKIVVKK